MLGLAIVWIGLISGDYARPLGEKALDQATLDAEGFGDKKALKREEAGLRVTLAPGEADAGWKTPQALRVGGDFTIVATLEIRRLPKPGQDDGAAIGLAIATQDLDQPEATLVREVEASGADVYRPIQKAPAAPGLVPQQVFDMFGQPIGVPPKPRRLTSPARGSTVRLEFVREGSTLRYLVRDEVSEKAREIGQLAIGPGEIAGVKLFATNRNGADPVDVVFRDLSIHADRIGGLGTAVRDVFGAIVHGDPTAIEAGVLVVGGPPPAPAPAPTPNPKADAKPEPKPAQSGPAKPAAEPAKPKARIALEDVESITFERSSTLVATFVGQPNVDATGPGGAAPAPAKPKAGVDDLTAPPPGTVAPAKVPKAVPKPNGIRDLHLALSGLREAAIKQVTVTAQTDKGPSSWRVDTSGSQDGPIAIRRAGEESWADLFLEPPAGDCRDKEFAVVVAYADGQAANAKAKATISTDPKLALDASAAAPPLDARVYLVGDEQLFGKLAGLTEEALALTTPWGDRLDVPIARVVGVYLGMADHKESPEAFAKRLKARGGEDLLLARAKDGEVVAISGVVEAIAANKLTFRYQEKARSLPLKGVEGFVLASRPDPKPAEGLRPTFTLAGGIVVSGRWLGIDAASWKVEAPWGQAISLPAAEVRSVRFRGGRMAYLSDLTPSLVEETPYFARRSPYRRDVGLAGGPLKVDGRAHDRGLAVHSRSALTYDLDRRYARFEALVGFDDLAKKKGRVDCRVFADGKELYANPDLRGDAPPVSLSLDVAGAEQLKLVVDFGPDEDTGDRVIWADARLYRPAPSAAPAAASPTPRPASGP